VGYKSRVCRSFRAGGVLPTHPSGNCALPSDGRGAAGRNLPNWNSVPESNWGLILDRPRASAKTLYARVIPLLQSMPRYRVGTFFGPVVYRIGGNERSTAVVDFWRATVGGPVRPLEPENTNLHQLIKTLRFGLIGEQIDQTTPHRPLNLVVATERRRRGSAKHSSRCSRGDSDRVVGRVRWNAILAGPVPFNWTGPTVGPLVSRFDVAIGRIASTTITSELPEFGTS